MSVMNIRTDNVTSRLAWKALARLRDMGDSGYTLLTIVGLIAIWGFCALTIYWAISVFWEIAP